ncbi:hypothetical protein BKA66DRAFT_602538 [Pyrenochaeta sp. MPI-SDFR-AT-0127]|nr:hypothetical protein BKA66DRAFT_602538 [Pyrenochaeta sp. MPI-SDFR-AT-0127]
MQAQYPQYHTVPLQHDIGGTAPGGYQQQTYTSPPPPQADMNSPFVHLLQLSVFQIYSVKEFEILRDRIQENLKTKQLRQEVINNMPPQPTTADAITGKLVIEYLSILGDGGMTFAASRFSVDKLMSGTLGMIDAMDQQSMKPCSTVVYSRWASPKEMHGPPIIVDILGWYKISDRSTMTGVQVKANTESKIRINSEKAFTVKEGKMWSKTWFRGRQDFLEVLVEGVEVKLGKVLAIERNLTSPIYGDFLGRWKEFKVPNPPAISY